MMGRESLLKIITVFGKLILIVAVLKERDILRRDLCMAVLLSRIVLLPVASHQWSLIWKTKKCEKTVDLSSNLVCVSIQIVLPIILK